MAVSSHARVASLLLGLIELSSVFIVLLAPTTWLKFGYDAFVTGTRYEVRDIEVRGIRVDGITGGDGWFVGITAACCAVIAIAFRFVPMLARIWAPGLTGAGLLIAATGFYDIFKDWSSSSGSLPPVTYDADPTVWLWLVAILGSLISIASLALLALSYAAPTPLGEDIHAEPEAEAWA